MGCESIFELPKPRRLNARHGVYKMLHDPHQTPEPILVVSGLTYLIPFYTAYKKGAEYDAYTCLFLTFTTVGFHGTRSEVIFALDCLAIVNFLARYWYLAKNSKFACMYYSSVIYSLVSYFVGQQYSILSFDPDWNTQMFYHSLMHLSTAYSAYLIQETN